MVISMFIVRAERSENGLPSGRLAFESWGYRENETCDRWDSGYGWWVVPDWAELYYHASDSLRGAAILCSRVRVERVELRGDLVAVDVGWAQA